MTMGKVRIILLGILGGTGLIFLAVTLALTLGFVTPEQMTDAGEAAQALPVLQWTFGGVGAVMLCVGAGLYIGLGRGEKRREELFLYGSIVSGVVEDIRCNRAVSVNNRHPWHVYVSCRHPVTGENVTVRSHSVFDLTVQAGDKVRVAFDPIDERRHAVELPQRGGWQ